MARDPSARREPILRTTEPLRQGESPRAAEPALRDLPVTTTPTMEGRPVAGYLGLVAGEALGGPEVLAEPTQGGLFSRGRRRGSAEPGTLADLREKALRDLKSRAAAKGADAVVGVAVAVQGIGDSVLVTATGTAVRLG